MKIGITLAFCLSITLPTVSKAGDPAPFPEFTFKKSKPPKAGTRKLITVQIEPKAESAQDVAKDTEEVPVAPVVASYDWFWQKVSPDLTDDTAARMRLAMDSLGKAPAGRSVPQPRLQILQTIVRAEGTTILRSTIGTRVSPALVLAVIAVESGGRVEAVSSKGAQGLMQLMPDTAKRFGVTDSLSSGENIKGGVAYLDWLLNEFDGDAVMALAGYNAGENAVKKHKGVPPYAETRDYVPKVLAAFEVAKGLCKTRPELITDACALTLAMN
ncbi:Soluble lytic murein transglycosylase precursor [Roseovarius litorisediminis]|uniref:Soluble lytic murein transglycosylase n=1 Tax=Roseovarius litorisediminis TaxID=1312363 RepID=A0A1Y5SHZ6_9RHOB|nr:lytic transglycosylase domain-containing protein [Roseovarius litorisediminis]SLN40934.1 Soluble lytic murein transglycosylase precursor [Roseovarius litorisediminis]